MARIQPQRVAPAARHREAEQAAATRGGHVGGDAIGIGHAVPPGTRLFAAFVDRGSADRAGGKQRHHQVAAAPAAADADRAGMRKAKQTTCGEIITGMIGRVGIRPQLHHAEGRDGGGRELPEISQRSDERIDQIDRALRLGRGGERQCEQGQHACHGSSGARG